MGDKTGIEWTDATWNPIRARHKRTGKVGHHCEHVSEGCRFCYAERMNGWRGTGYLYKPSLVDDGTIELFLDEDALLQPLRWSRPRSIFPCSMTDLFARFVPDRWRDCIFAVMSLTPQHRYIVLTKRPGRMREYLKETDREREAAIDKHRDAIGGTHIETDNERAGLNFFHGQAEWRGGDGTRKRISFGGCEPALPLPNVILGTSVEDRAAVERIDVLRATPAAARLLSIEPLLEDLGTIDLSGIHWVIVGGESGPKARPFNWMWAKTIVKQCRAAGVACFVKQLGSHPVGGMGDKMVLSDRKGGDMAEWPEDLRVREFP